MHSPIFTTHLLVRVVGSNSKSEARSFEYGTDIRLYTEAVGSGPAHQELSCLRPSQNLFHSFWHQPWLGSVLESVEQV